MPVPRARRSRSSAKRRTASRSVSAAVGSSINRMRASAPSAPAISTSCCSAIRSDRAGASMSIEAPTCASSVGGALTPRPPVDAPPCAAAFEPQREIFGDREIGTQGRLLIDRRDAAGAHQQRIGAIDAFAAHLDRPRIGREGAGDDADHRALAGAVLTDERVDLAGRNPTTRLSARARRRTIWSRRGAPAVRSCGPASHSAPSRSERRVSRRSRLIAARVLANLSPLMLRKAFRMSVHRGRETEYKQRHSPIWPSWKRCCANMACGTTRFSSIRRANDLFGYVEIDSEARWNAIASTDVCRRWWHSMSELMPSNADNSPVSRELREVFHIGSDGHSS